MSALGHKRTFAAHQPVSALGQKRTSARLFDHLVGNGEQLVRHGEAERLRRLHVQRHLELDRQLNRKLRWIGATENPIDVGRGAANYIAHEIISGV